MLLGYVMDWKKLWNIKDIRVVKGILGWKMGLCLFVESDDYEDIKCYDG